MPKQEALKMVNESPQTDMSIIEYDITEATIVALEKDYMVLTVSGVDDKHGFDVVHEARMNVKALRIAVEKKDERYRIYLRERRKELNSKTSEITDRLKPIEDHLQTEEDKVIKERERIKAEKIRIEQERVEDIRTKIEKIRSYVATSISTTSAEIQKMIEEVASINVITETYQEFTEEAMRIKTDILTALNVAYTERLTWEKAEIERKAEAERLAKQKAEQEEKDRALAAERRKIEADKATLETEKQAEAQKKKDAEFKRQAIEDARVQVEKEAVAKASREAKEAKEKAAQEAAEEAREEALRPDKEKLHEFAQSLCRLQVPGVSSEGANQILIEALSVIDNLVQHIKRKAAEL